MQFTKTIFLLFAVALACPAFIAAQEDGGFNLTADKLAGGKNVRLHKLRWKYHAGDDTHWAAADFDDSGWKSLTNDEINEDAAAALENWDGRAWYRIHLQVDEQLADQPLVFRMFHWGASE